MAQQRALAAAAHAEDGDDLAARDVEMDALQHVEGTVGEVEIADLHQRGDWIHCLTLGMHAAIVFRRWSAA
jgi:hypothetical protein